MNAIFPRWLTALFAGVVLTLVGVGIWFYHSQHQIARRHVEANLETIAQLKTDQIVQWRNERLADASQLMGSPFLTDAVAHWLKNPEPELTADLLARFRAASKHSYYRDVMLVDTNGRVRLSLNGRHGLFHPETIEALDTALRDRKPALSELQIGPGDLPPHLDVVAPLVVSNAETVVPCGAILLQCDARKFLYPLIQSWPVPSASAETLLVRRDGNMAVYMSGLRHQPNTALKLRVPLTETNAVAVMAVLGHKGVVQGRDYRGVDCISVVKAVPNSPWFLVAKMDVAEAFAAWHVRSALILALMFGFTIAVGIIAELVWQRTAKYYRYTRNLIEASLDPLVAINPELRILDANAATEKAIGRSRAELIGTDFAKYFTDPPKLRGGAEQAFQAGMVRNFPLELCQRDGQAASVLCNLSVYRSERGRKRCALAAVRDITERQRADAAFRRVHRAYRIITACNQALVRADNELELLNEVCRLIVEEGGFCFAWVGFAKADPAKAVKPVAYSGYEAGYLSAVTITWGEDDHGRGPTGTAIRTGKATVCRNTLTDPDFSPWRREALKRGYACSLVLPLLDRDRAFGALSIYATEASAFASDEIQLLTQLANDLAYGILSLRARSQHQQAEAEIRKLNTELEERVRERTSELAESEERLRLVLQASLTGTFEVDLQTGEGRWNDIEFALLGLKPGEVPPVPESFFRFIHPDDVQVLRSQWEEALHGGRLGVEFRVVRADGQVRWLAGKGQLVSRSQAKENGEIPGSWRGQFLGVNYDITERKQAEDALRRSEEQYRRLFDTTLQGVVYQNASGKIISMNPAAERILGKTAEEFIGSSSMEEARGTVREDGSPFPGQEHPTMIALRTGRPVMNEVMGIYNPKEQGYHWINIQAIPLFHPGESVPYQVYAIFDDITTRKRVEQHMQKLNAELQQRAVQLEAANKELESFSYSVSHDLRAPLRAIDGFSQIVLEDCAGQISTDGRKNLERVRAATLRMGELIDDLLKLSRLTRSELRVGRVDLSALAAAAADDLRKTDPDRVAEFVIAPEVVADGDAHLVRIVLDNLLGNAWKFTAKQPAARIEFGAVRHEGASAYFVRDNGVGFDMSYANKLFGAFQRLHTTAEFPGTGIGLATVRRIILRHGGRVWAESQPGRETTFYFTLPNQSKEAEP